jgi:hypothetical protein
MRHGLHVDNPSLSFGEIAKKLGELWKDLSDSEKAVYNELAKPVRGFRKRTQ